jgi:ComF family protein
VFTDRSLRSITEKGSGAVHTQTILNHSQQALQHLLDLIFPPLCSGCCKSGSILCHSCATQFTPIHPPICQRCNCPLTPDRNCPHCRYHTFGLTGLRVAYTYKDPLRTCIRSLKYQSNTRIASPLGSLLAKAYQASNIHADIIIPVPLHPKRLQQRGYNQAQLLAQACAQAIGIPLNSSLLLRSRETQAQALLRGQQRHSNVAAAFSCSSPTATKILEKRIVVIIDDVCTTGATLEACAAPLFAAGAREVWGLVLARPL